MSISIKNKLLTDATARRKLESCMLSEEASFKLTGYFNVRAYDTLLWSVPRSLMSIIESRIGLSRVKPLNNCLKCSS